MTEMRKKLSALNKGQKLNWVEKAHFRLKNRKWLNYSSNIARRVLTALDGEEGLSQKTLAEKIGVSPQYINKVVKGHENLSLETIAKLSDALGVELITFPDYKYNKTQVKFPILRITSSSFTTIANSSINKQEISNHYKYSTLIFTSFIKENKITDDKKGEIEINKYIAA